MDRAKVLDTAKDLISGDRAEDYGDADVSFGRIADGWNVIIGQALIDQGYITSQHVALMMTWLKMSRILGSLNHSDSYVDAAGYLALASEIGRPVTALQTDSNKSNQVFFDAVQKEKLNGKLNGIEK